MCPKTWPPSRPATVSPCCGFDAACRCARAGPDLRPLQPFVGGLSGASGPAWRYGARRCAVRALQPVQSAIQPQAALGIALHRRHRLCLARPCWRTPLAKCHGMSCSVMVRRRAAGLAGGAFGGRIGHGAASPWFRCRPASGRTCLARIAGVCVRTGASSAGADRAPDCARDGGRTSPASFGRSFQK